MKNFKLIIFFSLLGILGFSAGSDRNTDVSGSKTVTKQKRKTNYVEIQKKLKSLGYYHGKLDGIYGSQTKKAVSDYFSGDKTSKSLNRLLSEEGIY